MNKNRKQLKPLLLAASAILLATACNDDTFDLSRPIELHLAPAAPVTAVTRANVDALNFDADDKVGIYFAWKAGATGETPIGSSLEENAQWTTAATGTNTALYWQNTTDVHTVYAYYPYTADVTDDYKVAVTIPFEQTAEDEEKCNILYGTFSDKAQNNVQIQMRHCMSLVNITLKPGDGYKEDGSDMPTITKVTLFPHLHTSGTLDLATGTVTLNEEGTTPDITTYLLTDDTTPDVPDYRAILMPGETIRSIKITTYDGTDDGTPYVYEPETAPVTEANTQYNFTLELNKAGVTLGNLTIEMGRGGNRREW